MVVHPDVQVLYDAIEARAKRERQPAAAVWKALQACILRVKADGQWGEVIPRSKIPPYFRSRYDVRNLYCVDLPSFHRCFYTVLDRDVIFLDLVDHAAYSKWFSGRGR